MSESTLHDSWMSASEQTDNVHSSSTVIRFICMFVSAVNISTDEPKNDNWRLGSGRCCCQIQFDLRLWIPHIRLWWFKMHQIDWSGLDSKRSENWCRKLLPWMSELIKEVTSQVCAFSTRVTGDIMSKVSPTHSEGKTKVKVVCDVLSVLCVVLW